jgi:hypothetical protein
MDKILYEDDQISVIERNITSPYSRFTNSSKNNGQFALVLPYKKSKGKYQYLVLRELIAGWDEHPDLCAMTAPVTNTSTEAALDLLKKYLQIDYNLQSLIQVGVCSASKYSSDMYYLYGVDVSGYHGEPMHEDLLWISQEDLTESLDSQLITTMVRLSYIV